MKVELNMHNNNTHKQVMIITHRSSLFLLILLLSTFCVGFAVEDGEAEAQKQNPFTPKAFVIRYWDRAISNKLPKSSFLLSKASPLTASDAATYATLAAANTLSTRLPEFCSAAHLLCFPEVSPSLDNHPKDSAFSVYNDGQNFTNYGTDRPDGLDSFKNYSNGFFNTPVNDFRRYSRDSAGHNETFTSYGDGNNVVDQSFHTYGTNTAGGAGDFKSYGANSNVPNLGFTTYSTDGVGREQKFSQYSENGNAGDQSFTSYGKESLGAANDFSGYGTNSNVASSGFSNYAEKGTSAKDTFTNYGVNMNNPTETFKNYAKDSVFAAEKFSNYRDQANVGADSFQSYAEGARGGDPVEFKNYGKSFNEGTDTFKGYAKGADIDQKVNFKGYGVNNTFKDYSKHGISFAGYTKRSSKQSLTGNLAKKWVEPGKFFRERMLKSGTVIPMPDVTDKMPKRSFLPRSILTKLPFKSSDLKRVFRISDNSSMDKMIVDSVGECGRAPSAGETKRCVGSIEDMIDFAASVLGRNVTVRATENVNGSGKTVMVGRVYGVNGGKVTKSMSCHQSLFPYLLYYCHSVPKVRVYEADLLNPVTKAKINHGVAICHLDTTAWSPTHGAFMALGSGPGRIEVCHWIFENDMTWTTAD
ncbi:polygalacturonase 1 beta-like protein 3 [Lotus japonicus]|uniref:polygalacturonase 1 beta-like protein 3 n=1 Tax=Lotus japonicus TaxID=34305 RepID=UPI002587211C|nr:polygalacturonase 1 beta-like protein 3 [Lotus japonicus]